MNFANEVFDHCFGDFEVSDNAVFERPDGLDKLVGLLMHLHGSGANGNGLPGARIDRDDRRLINDYVSILDDQRVGCPQIYGNFLYKKTE